MKIVLDTNIWISGLLFGGNPLKIIELAKKKKITIICSIPLLNEIAKTINYSKFKNRLLKLQITPEDLLSIVYNYSYISPIFEIDSIEELRDIDDLKIIATAFHSQAIVIVSGDNDLLILKEYQGILILTAREFLARYFNEDK